VPKARSIVGPGLVTLFASACGTSPTSPSDGGTDVAIGADSCGKCGAGITSISVLNNAGSGIVTFSVSASGDVAPTSVIAGAQTNISNASGLAADGQGNLYVSTELAILVFAHDANGNVAPIATLAGPTALPTIDNFASVSVMPDGTVFATAELASGTTRSPEILVFPPGSNGNVAPARTIASTTMTAVLGSSIALSSVAVMDASQHALFFDATASGSVAPQRSLQTVAGVVEGMALDGSGALYLADYDFGVSSAVVYSATAQDTDAPITTLTGSMTGITSIGGIAVDPSGTMYVANADPSGASILVFAMGSNGNIAPLRTIAGASTTLAGDASQYPMPIIVR
jgi:hypothetical protein